jgi:hypothetical protein
LIPDWLHGLSWAALALGLGCAAVIAVDVVRHPQHMWIMNVVWPVTAAFGTVLALAGYFRYGRLARDSLARAAVSRDETPPHKKETPFAAMVGKGAAHCGSGCTLGDICAEWLAYAFPALAVWFGWKGLFQDKMFAVWMLDYLFAFVFGIAFQYFTIKPMRDVSPGRALVDAVKADTLSLTAWQVGMYGFMALADLYVFRVRLDTQLEVASPEFWFMMQIAMLAGFATAYPVNWWLIRTGVKEKM